ncbi:MAG: hypothetical protein ISS35_04585 [Kiritimatiellae bacterium]|nr:hypothetical protein [Kiritimatiellia bacterium]
MFIVFIIISLIGIPVMLASFLLAQECLDQIIIYLKRHRSSSWESLGCPPAFFIPLPGALPARGLPHRMAFAIKLFFSTPGELLLNEIQRPVTGFRRYTLVTLLTASLVLFTSCIFFIVA